MNIGLIIGGFEVFVFVMKLCYGIDVEFLFLNVVGFWCVVEYFEVMEELDGGNVNNKVEVYFNFVVLNLWDEFFVVLQICEYLLFLVEELQIV